MFERGNLRLRVEPGRVVLERDQYLESPGSLELAEDELRWLITAAGPAALAAGMEKASE